MATQFDRSLAALRREQGRGSLTVAGTSAFLSLLVLAWALFARITVYEVSEEARLESVQETHPVQSLVEGRVIAVDVKLGDRVKAGDVLVELDGSDVEARRAAARSRRDALAQRVKELEGSLQVIGDLAASSRATGHAAVGEAASRSQAVLAQAALAQDELGRLKTVQEQGAVSDLDVAKAQEEATRLQHLADAARISQAREGSTYEHDRLDATALLRQVAGELAETRGEEQAADAELEGLDWEISQRRLVAPISGTVGEAPRVRVGTVVSPHDVLLTLVPDGAVRIVAGFPAAAAGRIVPGQQGDIRLDGFPWTRFGRVEGVVRRAALESTEGTLRVELDLSDPESSRIPLQHGLTGSVEVAVERISPAGLLLREAGRLLRPGAPK